MIAETFPNFKERKLDIKLSCIDVRDIFLAEVDDVVFRQHVVFAVDDVLGPAGLRLARSAIMNTHAGQPLRGPAHPRARSTDPAGYRRPDTAATPMDLLNVNSNRFLPMSDKLIGKLMPRGGCVGGPGVRG